MRDFLKRRERATWLYSGLVVVVEVTEKHKLSISNRMSIFYITYFHPLFPPKLEHTCYMYIVCDSVFYHFGSSVFTPINNYNPYIIL